MWYKCLICFHEWKERFKKAKERRCSLCKSSRIVRLFEYDQAVRNLVTYLKWLKLGLKKGELRGFELSMTLIACIAWIYLLMKLASRIPTQHVPILLDELMKDAGVSSEDREKLIEKLTKEDIKRLQSF